jgi:hypothetical protein
LLSPSGNSDYYADLMTAIVSGAVGVKGEVGIIRRLA